MDLKQPIDLIKRSSWCDLLLVGLLVTPASMIAWTKLIQFAGVSESARGGWVLVLVLIHFLAIGFMILGSSRYRRHYRSLTLITGYLVAKGYTMVRFETFRGKYGKEFSDEYLMKVIQEFPQYLRIAKLSGDDIGVAMLSNKERSALPADAPQED